MYVTTPTTMERTWRHVGAGAYTCGFAAMDETSTSIAPKFAKALNARPPRRGVPPH